MKTSRMLVVGSGERVQGDLLPVLSRLSGALDLGGIFARTEKSVTVGKKEYAVSNLDALCSEDIEMANLIYVAVTKGAVPKVLEVLCQHSVSEIDLIIDTPVFLFRDLRFVSLLNNFRKVWVAEDCSTLPWIELVHQAAEGPVGPLKEVVFDRSAWRYHGHAMAKTLLQSQGPSWGRRRGRGGGCAEVHLRFSGGKTATIVEPRDYGEGRVIMTGRHGTLSDAGEADHHLVARVEDGWCTGFSIGDLHLELDDDERALAGPMEPEESVTRRMDDFKRVGLFRMVRSVLAGEEGYPLFEGLDDMVTDAMIEKFPFYWGMPLTRIRTGPGRLALSALGRLSGGG